jgi:hypothetical protein
VEYLTYYNSCIHTSTFSSLMLVLWLCEYKCPSPWLGFVSQCVFIVSINTWISIKSFNVIRHYTDWVRVSPWCLCESLLQVSFWVAQCLPIVSMSQSDSVNHPSVVLLYTGWRNTGFTYKISGLFWWIFGLKYIVLGM